MKTRVIKSINIQILSLVAIILSILTSNAIFSQTASKGLISSTYFGGASTELFVLELDEFDMIQHPNGDIYVCGPTQSFNIPITQGAFQSNYAGGDSDSFVARFDSNLEQLVASTYLGGSAQDIASSMVIDNDGNICVAGHTTSENFPITAGAYDTSYLVAPYSNQFDVFVTILNPDLDDVIASTYLGGSDPDYFNQIRVTTDTIGNIIVTGATISGDFPVTPNAYSTTGGVDTGPDAFISKFSPDLSELLASTYFGGGYLEQVLDILVNEYNQICICGITGSPDFPTTSGAYSTFVGEGDGYIAIFSNNLDSLLISTCLGGVEIDNIFSMDIDTSGNFFVCGYTESFDYPCTLNAFDTTFNYGTYDGFVSKLDSKLKELIASTYVGSSGWDFCRDIIYDSITDEVFITGLAGEFDFPITPMAFDSSFNGESDLFITHMQSDLKKVIASTFIGGNHFDFGLELLLVEEDNLYVAGNSLSNNFPTTLDAYSKENSGYYDVTISLIDKTLSGISVGIKQESKMQNHENIDLLQIYPNPFKDRVTLKVLLIEPSDIEILIRNSHGQIVRKISNKNMSAGVHHIIWDGKDQKNCKNITGLYFVELLCNGQRISDNRIIKVK